MATDGPFRPSEVETLMCEDGESIKMVLTNDAGEKQEAVFDRRWVPFLITQLQRRIVPGQATPIDRDSLRPGQTFSLQGYEIRHEKDIHPQDAPAEARACRDSPGGPCATWLRPCLPSRDVWEASLDFGVPGRCRKRFGGS